MKPYYERDGITIFHGDCREILPHVKADCVVTDPPYGDTSLAWDRRETDWVAQVDAPQVWAFGSMRYWIAAAPAFQASGWKYAQEIVWEKHNGSSFHADRFRRVHEFALHWYRGEWAALHHEAQTTSDATKRAVRRKERPPHTGESAGSTYVSEDGGPRLMRSVLQVRSAHGEAAHPTQKPLGIVQPLIRYSCPPAGAILDPFMGSGTTLVAAKLEGRKAIGIEIEERYCEIAVKRLAQGVLNFE